MSNAQSVWLFLGPEIGEKQSVIKDLRKRLANNSEIEETVFYAGETHVSDMVSVMRNGSLFSELRLFIIKYAEEIKKKDDIDLLSAYIAAPMENTFLIIVSDETSIARGIEKNISPSNKRIFWELFEDRKIEWVENFFRKDGFRISRNGVDTILELVENNTAALKQECSRLLFFFDREKEISGEEAEKWLSHTREESAFTLFSRIAAGDFSRSLESIRMLLAANEAPVAIFAALASCFRKLICYTALKEAGVRDESEYRNIGVSSPGAKRDYAAAGSRYDSARAEKCLALTTEYDFILRSSLSFPGHILMDSYLHKIHSLARVPS